MPVAEARRVNDAEAPVMFGPAEEVRSVRDEVATQRRVGVRIYEPEPEDAPTLVYFHGGGWVVGSLDSHDGVARFLSRFGGCRVVAVDYALGPERKFPEAVEDAWAVTTWLARGVQGLAVGGDSAGGNLAAVVAQRARDAGLPLALQLLVYPVLDCELSGANRDDYGYWVEQYLRTADDAAGPEASPLRARDLRGLPPALLLSCALDPLIVQADSYAHRLRAAGVVAEHRIYPDLIHGAYRMPAVLPAARRMLAESATALRDAFGR